jgi:prepilin-type N-terminal cleavage/methylation domain-containing protein
VSRRRNGYSLAELLIALAIIGLFVSIGLPSLARLNRRTALRAAAGELRSIFHMTRMRAITRGTNCGIKFIDTGDEWQFAIYDDGDRDGVRNDDIYRGIDRRVTAPRPVLRESRAVTIGLIEGSIDDPDGEPLDESPVRFGRSAICSFSPYGEATSGTIYLTDRELELYAVRVYGATAKIRTLRYDIDSERWSGR